MKWFKHDSDAHRDAKLRKVVMKYGMEGYGLYWHCIELIVNNISSSNITFELEHDAEVISHDTGIHQDVVQEMMTFMVSLGLFENQDGVLTCLKIAKRLDQSMTSSPQMRKLIDEIRVSHDPVMIKSCKTRQDKKRDSRFAPPSIQEISEYCNSRNNNVDPEQFWAFYDSKGWMIGKSKMKNWKSSIITWEKRDDTPKPDYTGAI